MIPYGDDAWYPRHVGYRYPRSRGPAMRASNPHPWPRVRHQRRAWRRIENRIARRVERHRLHKLLP